MAAYRPAALVLGASLILGAVSNASLTALTAWTGERFGTRLKAQLFRVVMAQDQVRACSRSGCCPHFSIACGTLLRLADRWQSSVHIKRA